MRLKSLLKFGNRVYYAECNSSQQRSLGSYAPKESSVLSTCPRVPATEMRRIIFQSTDVPPMDAGNVWRFSNAHICS